MKRKISVLLLVLTLLFILTLPVSAADWAAYDFILSKDFQTITYGERVYHRIEDAEQIVLEEEYDEWTTAELSFEDADTQSSYGGSRVEFRGDAWNAVLIAHISYGYGVYSDFYVAEDCLPAFQKVQAGQVSTFYTTDEYFISKAAISAEQLAAWRQEPGVQLSAMELRQYATRPYYTVEPLGVAWFAQGLLLRDEFTDEIYLLCYDEYGQDYFYRGRDFATDHPWPVTIYPLKDEALRQELLACFNTTPEDDLGWMVEEDESVAETVMAVVYTIFFCLLPIAVVVFGVVLLIITKRQGYRLPLAIMIGAAVAVLAVYLVFFFWL